MAESAEAAVTPAASEPAVVAPESKPLEVAEFVHKEYERLAAAESETEEPAAQPEGEQKPAEAAVVTPEPQVAATAKEPPFTEEELSDGAFLGRLDTPGWEKLLAYNPALYKSAKAVAKAQGTVFELKRRLEAQVQPETEAKPQISSYEEARAKALEKADSLDPAERAEGIEELADLRLQKRLGEMGIDPVETQAASIERAAFRVAVQTMPELATLPTAELDAAVESDPELMDDVALAITLDAEPRMRLLSKVMRRAGQHVLNARSATKATADAEVAKAAAKQAESQTRLRSNKDNPSTVVIETPSGKMPKGDKTIEDTVHEKVAALKLA